MKISNNTIGNRTRNLSACSAVPQPTASPRASSVMKINGRNSLAPRTDTERTEGGRLPGVFHLQWQEKNSLHIAWISKRENKCFKEFNSGGLSYKLASGLYII